MEHGCSMWSVSGCNLIISCVFHRIWCHDSSSSHCLPCSHLNEIFSACWAWRVFPVWQHSLFACLWVALINRADRLINLLRWQHEQDRPVSELCTTPSAAPVPPSTCSCWLHCQSSSVTPSDFMKDLCLHLVVAGTQSTIREKTASF